MNYIYGTRNIQTFNRQNIQEPNYRIQIFNRQNIQNQINIQIFNRQNIQEPNYETRNNIQTCRQNCGNTIEFVNQVGINLDQSLEDISKYFKKFGNIVQILKFNLDKQYITVYCVEFYKNGSVNSVFQQKKPHIIKSWVYENGGHKYLNCISLKIFCQSTKNHLQGCNYSIQNQTNDGKGLNPSNYIMGAFITYIVRRGGRGV